MRLLFWLSLLIALLCLSSDGFCLSSATNSRARIRYLQHVLREQVIDGFDFDTYDTDSSSSWEVGRGTTDAGDTSDIDVTRESLYRIIEDSWSRVTKLVPEKTLAICESDLKAATSLLVLATIRKAADDYPSSRLSVEAMLKAADSNHDGQLSAMEWFDWLGSDSASFDSAFKKKKSTARVSRVERLPDPMVLTLGDVLGHAVCSLKVIGRMTDDPSILSAAFIAGGVAAGVLDKDVCLSMLARLEPAIR